ncbi:MAG TPA: carotenoid oxygenase family protein [Geobacteraceae bacterium]|nr:carotenoid oxygenase family protein [Geobacteraceae bacterium]
MPTRREFLLLAGGAGLALALPGCGASPPLKKDIFTDFGDPARPYLGMATSLRQEHDYEAHVEGTIPPELRGTLYRNGPGLFDRDGLRRRTVLDGDGMVQSFTFHDRGVRYRNRFVRTGRYAAEEAAGKYLYPSWCTQAPGGVFANIFRPSSVTSQASVTVYRINDRFYAFDEIGLPYELDPVTLATIGETSFGLPRQLTTYAAHSKVDAQTGEWLHFGLSFGKDPFIHITIFTRSGSLHSHRAFPMPRYNYMHDWFVSDRWLVFNVQPVEIHFWGFLFGFRSLYDSLRWAPGKGGLLMVVERDGNAAPILIEAPPLFMWHSVNARTEKGEIIADFIGYENPDHFIGPDPVATALMAGRKGDHNYPGILRRFVIDPAKRSLITETVAGENFEFPRINGQHLCHPYRFCYTAQGYPGEFFTTIIARVDMTTGKVASHDFGKGQFCSEPVFVPLPGRSYRPDDAEEPGWLLTEVYDSATLRSHLAVLRAERVGDGPLARVLLTHHAPFSYHGWWSAA